jgi:hypothetical protein
MSDLYNKVKKNVLGSKDLEAINQLDVMEGKTSSGKGHFDTKEGSVRHVYVTKDNVPTSTPSEFLKRRMKMAGPETLKKVPGTIGKAVGAGALAGVALEKGINKLKSMEGKEAESEIPSNVEGKSKGGMVRFKKQYQMHNGKF